MGVPFKKIARKDPRKADAVAKFYPQLVTLGDNATLDDIAYVMKEKSSLTLGDIQSVLTNFVEAMIATLYNGQSVNIKNFGVFSLSARTAGVLDVKECTAKNIKAVKINFRPSSTVRPDIAATRAGQKIDFYDLEALVNKGDGEGGSSGRRAEAKRSARGHLHYVPQTGRFRLHRQGQRYPFPGCGEGDLRYA